MSGLAEGTPADVTKYLVDHNLQPLFKDMLAALLYHKPKRPLEVMIRSLREIQDKKDRHETFSCLDIFRQFSSKPDESETTMEDATPEKPFSFPASMNTGPSSARGLSDRFQQSQQQTMMSFNRMRRGSVSAESMKPSDDDSEMLVIPKSNEARMRIAAAISQNLLFRNLEPDQKREVVDAMFEKKVPAGSSIIKQGDEGDNFYVVDSGSFDVYVNDKKVVEIGQGGSFGELALMYNTPRAATCTASEDSVLWAVDRVTFRRCITNNTFRKRKLYESFLKALPLLSSLEPGEIVKVADALEPIEFEAGDTIVEQGAHGDSFYILVEGQAVVTKTENMGAFGEDANGNAEEPKEVMRLKAGDYFGEIALINDSPRTATVTASTPHVKCVTLEVGAFIRLMGPVLEILKRNMDQYKKYENQISTMAEEEEADMSE